MRRLRGRGLDDVLDRFADLERDLELGAGKAFRRIFELIKSVPRAVSASALTCLAASTAIFLTPFGSVRKTTSRCKADVEL